MHRACQVVMMLYFGWASNHPPISLPDWKPSFTVSRKLVHYFVFFSVQVIFSTADHSMYRFLRRLFNTSSLSEDVRRCVDKLYSKEVKIYSGYCDDPRNTDNAWLEIVAYNYHDDNYTLTRCVDEVLLLPCAACKWHRFNFLTVSMFWQCWPGDRKGIHTFKKSHTSKSQRFFGVLA